MLMKLLFLQLFCFVLFNQQSSAASSVHLFTLERTTNANFINYDANLKGPGTFDDDNPVIAYWIMSAVDGHREGLTNFENANAYGFTTKRNSNGSYTMSMKAIPNENIQVLMVKGRPQAEIEIDGKMMVLKKIFIKLGGGLIPKVKSIQISGVDPHSGESVSKKIIP